jgi:hypothetical protein
MTANMTAASNAVAWLHRMPTWKTTQTVAVPIRAVNARPHR